MATLRDAVAGFGLLALPALCGCQGLRASIPVAPFPAPPPTATPLQRATPGPGPSATATPNASGVVNISVPTPSPVLCSPNPVTVRAGAIAIATCSADGYGGPISFVVVDRSIATVSLAPQFLSTYFVTGVSAGTTSLELQYVPGGTGSLTIDVTP